MPRPRFPSPYCVLPVEVIRRINEEIEHYDKNPEAAEREQKRRQEVRDEEKRQEQEEERRAWQETQE